MNIPPQKFHHAPVLLQAVIDVLKPQIGETYLDLTAGYGGHAREVIAKIGDAHKATLVDRDDMAIQALQPLKEAGVNLVHNDFASQAELFVQQGKQFDTILVDLGVSSPQFDIPERGFSIRFDAPLDMRMDQSQGETVAELLYSLSEEDLANVIFKYGEERQSRKIAHAIKLNLPITTTFELKDIVQTTVHPKQRIDAVKRTFQALRIAVNEELKQVERMLDRVIDLLAPGGRIAIISFHSLEDRLVKRFMQNEDRSGYEARLSITSKAIRGNTEDVSNPRARSATLRAAAKIKTK